MRAAPVEEAMAATPSLIPELEDVVERGSPERRAETVKRIAALFLSSAQRFNEEHVSLFDGVLGRLIVEIETKAKAELSQRLAPVPNAPIEVVRALARDDDISVAGPVLMRSERLGESDLVELARTKGPEHLLAISGRRAIGKAVTDVLVRRGDRHVARKVAANRQAQLSETGFSGLVQRAGRDGILAEKVALRPDIPPHLFHDLVTQATQVVRDRLLASVKAQNPSDIGRILNKVSGEVGAAVPQRDYTRAQQMVQALQRARRLDERAVIAFTKAGRIEEIVAGLALLCGVPIEVVDRLIGGDRADPVLILCKAIGFSWPTTRGIMALRPGTGEARTQVLDAASANFERLLPATAQRVVRFWQLPQSDDPLPAAN
jgi:uncharacterized protein (DUF2336 family)